MTAIRELMTANPRTASSSSSIIDIARMMRDEDVGMIPIVDNGSLTGIVTDRDLVIRGIAEGQSDVPVEQVMSRQPAILRPDDTEETAERLMARNEVRRLPVCDGGKLVGVVSVGDLAVRATPQRAGEVMEETGPQG